MSDAGGQRFDVKAKGEESGEANAQLPTPKAFASGQLNVQRRSSGFLEGRTSNQAATDARHRR
jgi:hypothetical protein